MRYVKIVPCTVNEKPFKADMPIRIKRIILGIRVSKESKERIERIVRKIDDNIVVEKIKRQDIKFWAKNDINKEEAENPLKSRHIT